MRRRGFLAALFAAPAVVKAAPALVAAEPTVPTVFGYPVVTDPLLKPIAITLGPRPATILEIDNSKRRVLNSEMRAEQIEVLSDGPFRKYVRGSTEATIEFDGEAPPELVEHQFASFSVVIPTSRNGSKTYTVNFENVWIRSLSHSACLNCGGSREADHYDNGLCHRGGRECLGGVTTMRFDIETNPIVAS